MLKSGPKPVIMTNLMTDKSQQMWSGEESIIIETYSLSLQIEPSLFPRLDGKKPGETVILAGLAGYM